MKDHVNVFDSFEVRAYLDGFGIFAPNSSVPFYWYSRCSWHMDEKEVRKEAEEELRRLQSKL